jgi:Flp pilus assembly CpaF family ATPase
MTMVPAPSAPGLVDDSIPEGQWPDIREDVVDIAAAMAAAIQRLRQQHDIKASVRHEEELPRLVEQVVTRAVQQPQLFQLHASTANRLAADPGFRDAVERGTQVRASYLYPVSRLLYLLDGVEEVHVNRWDEWILTWAAGKQVLRRAGNPFQTNEEVLTFFRERVIQMPGFQGQRQLNEGHPIAEGNLGNLLRVCVIQRPAVTGDSSVIATLRFPSAAVLSTLDDYVQEGVMPFGVAQLLTACVAGKASMIVAGGTATGKTTLLRVLCGLIPAEEQVLVIEDSAELHLEHDRGDGRPWHPHAQQICTVPPSTNDAADVGVTMRHLVKAALRLRPDRIVLGEARDAAMADVCSASTTGHEGSMVSLHADDAMRAVKRAAQYVMMSPDYRGAANVSLLAEGLVHQAFDLVLHLSFDLHRRRVVSGVVALGEEPGHVAWIYRTDPESGRLRRETSLVGDLPPGLRRKLQGLLASTEVPAPL